MTISADKRRRTAIRRGNRAQHAPVMRQVGAFTLVGLSFQIDRDAEQPSIGAG
jgi:hypothetical protein